MKRSMWWGPLVLLVLVAPGRPAAAVPAPADRTSLTRVPATAPIVLHLRGVEGAKDRLLVTLKNALPEKLPLIQSKLEDWVKDGIDGRKLAGVPKDGPIFVVFTEVPKQREEPKIAIVLAVNKYEEFRDSLLKEDERKSVKASGAGVERAALEIGKDLYFVDKKGFAVVTPYEEVANALAKKYAGIDGKIGRAEAMKLLSADVSAYVNLETVRKEYGDKIKDAKEEITKALEQAGEQVGKAQKSSIDLVKKLIGPAFQALDDSEGLLLTVEFRPAGFALHVQSDLRNGSTTSAELKGLKLSAFEGLDRLLPGEVVYTGLQTSTRMLEALGGLMLGASGQEGKAFSQALELLAKAGPGTRVDSSALPVSGVQVWHFEDPKKAVAAEVKLFEAAQAGSGLQGGIVKEKPEIKRSARKYGDFDLNAVELTWDLDKMAEQGSRELPEEIKKHLVEGMKSLVGEKLGVWFGTDGKVLLQVTAPDWDKASELLDRYFKGNKTAGDVAAFRNVRKELPAEANMIFLMDLVRYGVAIVDMIKPMFGGLLPLPPGYPAKPGKDAATYVGAAVALQAERGSVDLFVSAATIHQAFKTFVQPFMPGN
jgi:hypothetical protein